NTRSTRTPEAASEQGSTMVSVAKGSGSTSGRRPAAPAAVTTSASRSSETPSVTSMTRVSRGSPWTRTAWPPMTVYGIRAAASALATRSRTSESTEDPRPTDVLFDPLQRIPGRQDAELPGFLQHALVEAELLLERQ